MTAATASAGATASSVASGSEELKQTAAEPGSAGTEASVDLGREPRPAEGEAASKEGVKGEVEEEEEEECGFCKWMKAGGCREVFIAWEQCVESNRKEGDSSYTETCLPQTLALRECMAEHRSYYAPLLEAEEAEEAAQKGEAQDSGAAPPPPPQQQQDNSNQAGGS